jgi:hypothetical protein
MTIRKVTSEGILDGTIAAADLSTGCVTSSALATGAVTSNALATGAVTSSAIATGAVGTTQLATGSVTSSIIVAGAVGNTQLAAGAVATSNLIDANVTTAKIANLAVTSAKLATGAVTTTTITDANVTTAKLANLSVTSAKLATGAAQANIGYTAANIAGDTFLGPVILNADPTGASGAATKNYVDVRLIAADIEMQTAFQTPLATGAAGWGKICGRLTTLPADLSTSVAICLAGPASGPSKFGIAVDEAVVATVSFGTGATGGTFDNTPGIPASIATGSRIELYADNSVFDTSIVGVMVTIPATVAIL